METLPRLFRYTAREYDTDTGLYHYRARAYDPATGRFLQEDPIGFEAGDLNVHRYVWNNPINWVDPSGLLGIQAGLVMRIMPPVIFATFAFASAKDRYVYKSVTTIAGSFSGPGTQGGFVGGWLLGGAAAAVEWASLYSQGVAGQLLGFRADGTPYGVGAVYAVPPFNGPDDWTPGAPPPGEGWEWRGRPGAAVGGREGGWVRPTSGGRGKESVHDDRDHPTGKPPHIGWVDEDGNHWENYGDGWIPKK